MADTFSAQTSKRKILYIYYNITCDMADTFSAQTSTRKILFIYYNITCEMADTFSAFFKVHLTFPHYHENLLLFSDTIIIITLKIGINIIYTSGRYVQPKCVLQLLLDALCKLLFITGVITTTVMDRILSNNN